MYRVTFFLIILAVSAFFFTNRESTCADRLHMFETFWSKSPLAQVPCMDIITERQSQKTRHLERRRYRHIERTLPASGQLEISCHISLSPFKKCLELHTKCRIWTTIPPSPFITTVTVCVRGKSVATVFWWKTHCYRTHGQGQQVEAARGYPSLKPGNCYQ